MNNCPVCEIGYMQPDHIPYLHFHHGQIVLIPNVPAEVCDHCAHTIQDPDVVGRLAQLFTFADDENNVENERDEGVAVTLPGQSSPPLHSFGRSPSWLVGEVSRGNSFKTVIGPDN